MSRRVLVVEDDASLTQLFQGARSVDPDRVAPVVTASGREALRLKDRGNFDTLLVDLALPDMDGIELLVRAKQLHPGVKTFALSSSSSPELHVAALDSGAAEVLRKPLDVQALLETLECEEEESGRLASLGGDFDIADLCLLEALSGRGGGIQAGTNGSTSRLVVADGALIHASSGDLQGLAAFKQILNWNRLDFDWMPAEEARRLPLNVRLDTAWLLKIAQWRQRPEGHAQEACRADGLLSGVHLQDLLSLLEKKQETGMLSVAATGRFGALVFQGGQIVQADTDEEHGPAALAEIRSWRNLRVTYSRTADRPTTHEGDTSMADFGKLIDELAGEVSEFLSTGIVRISDGKSVIERSSDPAFVPTLSSYAAVVRAHVATAELLGGGRPLGDTEDLLISMEKSFLLIRMLGPNHFHALLLGKLANPALARFVMRQYEPFFLEVLQRTGG